MHRHHRSLAAAVLVALGGAVLGACAVQGSSTEAANPSGIGTPPAVASALPGATPSMSLPAPPTPDMPRYAVCDEASIRAGVEQYLATSPDVMAGDQLQLLNEFECSTTWAVAFPDVGPTPDEAVTYTYVLQDVDGDWVVRDRDEEVCGDNAATTWPADALIPESLWEMGCRTN